MLTLRKIWRCFTFARFERELHEEIARQAAEISRLRAENRALLNSILGVAGMKPLPPVPLTNFTTQSPSHRHSESPAPPVGSAESLRPPPPLQPATSSDSSLRSRDSETGTRNDPSSSDSTRSLRAARAPLRRRSWHQINRMLELQSARKPVNGEA